LFEARDRLGGRVLTQHSARGLALDLGPSWYWPSSQPSITRLVEDLKLASVAQADDGRVLWLDDPNRPPRPVALGADGRPAEGAAAQPGAVHGGARRLVGGMEGLVRSLASALPDARLRLGQALECLEDRGDHVVLHLRSTGSAQPAAVQSLRARHVVLALPPRIVQETVDFKPGLPDAIRQALGDTPTWMATAAKATVAYAQPFWRSQGHTGNAWVTHPQAMLAEVFDLGLPEPEPSGGDRATAHPQGGALGGFLAQGVGPRRQMRLSQPLLIESQLGMLFGPAAGDGEIHVQDWAEECWTCSPADRALEGQAAAHPTSGPTILTEPLWSGRLLFGGSETAVRGSGYLEGALNAAARVRRQLDAQRSPGR
jgi:monoamine oxidase